MNQSDCYLAKILVVDDTPDSLNALSDTLESEGYQIFAAPSGEIALKVVDETTPDLILLDVLMPGIDGLETCRQLKRNESTATIPVIFITAKGDTKDVLRGFEVGGVDYITKPFEREEVVVRIKNHLLIHQLTQALIEKNSTLEQEIAIRKAVEAERNQVKSALQKADERLFLISEQEAQRWQIEGFVGTSKAIGKILNTVRQLHQTGTTNVLITGESGTGKELIARAIHFGGPRAKGMFIPVNCSAIPDQLAESIFFGHVRGAFTGANTTKKGYFELADGGTLFLDEIGDMPLPLQAKLLRVLEDGSFIPIGGDREHRVDVRIISATNTDLQSKSADGEFRDDLYFRLTGFTVAVPPLRDRIEDIPLLAEHFLDGLAAEMGREKPALGSEALSVLTTYSFPGNVRELSNIIEGALIRSKGTEILAADLHLTRPSDENAAISQPISQIMSYSQAVDNFQRRLITRVLNTCGWSRREAAKRLSMHRPNLIRLMKRLGIRDQ